MMKQLVRTKSIGYHQLIDKIRSDGRAKEGSMKEGDEPL
jgi:hypothetical protein